MNKLKSYFFVILYIFILNSCGTVREGFQNPKKNNSDEFLVEKKSPLVIPPEFEELPFPKENEAVSKIDKNNLKQRISDNQNETTQNSTNKNLEESLLEKIKKN